MEGQNLDLIQALEKERKRRKLDGNAFSTLLGVNYACYSRTKTRARPPSKRMLMAILRHLPNLSPYVEAYMKQGDHDTIQKGK